MITLNQKYAWLLSGMLFIGFLIHAFYLDGSYGGGDGIRHYLVSRWSWNHPDLFLYHWGKPFFTLVTSPFSQFGLMGIKCFNALLGALTAYLGFLIANKLGFKHKLLAIIFTSFSPVYILCINSGLTEPMFAFQLTLCIWLFLEEKYVFGSIILSFLPFVRSEGNLMFPLFGLILIIRARWKLLPFLGFGTVLYSIVGYFYYKDIFWIKTKNPYTGQNFDIYGQGELLHYANAYKIILGIPMAILFVIGIIFLFYKLIKYRKNVFSKYLSEEFILIYGSFLIYFIAHSIFWWKGLFGSLGLERSIAAVMPLAGLIALRGLEFVTISAKFSKQLTYIIVFSMTVWILLVPFRQKYVPLKLNAEEQLVKIAGLWFNDSEYKNEKIYYLYPYFMHIIELDAFDGNRVGELWGLYPTIKEWGIDAIPLNTVILWDAHFSANEAHIPLEKMMSDPHFKLIKSFKPADPFKTLGDYNFEIHAFLRVKEGNVIKSAELKFDLENEAGLGNGHTISSEKSISGTRSAHVKPSDEYGILFEKNISDIENFQKIFKVYYEFKINANKPINDLQAVMSVDDNTGSIHWVGKVVNVDALSKWNIVQFEFPVNASFNNFDSKLKLYTWNKGKNDYFIDDIRIYFHSH